MFLCFLLIFKLCLNISKATDEVTLQLTLLPKSLATKLIGFLRCFLLIFKLCLNISKATNQVTLPFGRGLRPLLHFINFVDALLIFKLCLNISKATEQSRFLCFKLTKLGSSSLPKSLSTKFIGNTFKQHV